ncbi:MAG: peptidoglycan glycosyltransferase [Clostridiales bacterium]|nr:peptidoglycan glycosyltransferase [Clostridiales bacterium]
MQKIEKKNRTFHRKKIWLVFLVCALMLLGLIGRLIYLMGFRPDYYYEKAENLHEREREIKAARGRILDAGGTVLADNTTVCTVSVIHSQIEDEETVIQVLSRELEMDEETVRARVEKVSSMERIKANVEKSVGDVIREYGLAGVKVDEDYRRTYPYGSLASRVLGFTGSDNQGIIGLEVEYDDVLSGTPGKILTTTDARGIEIEEMGESREEPVEWDTLRVSLDVNIQMYAQQAAQKVMEEKSARSVSILMMNPQNGEIYACVNVPEFDLNDPFTLNTDVDTSSLGEEELQDLRNQMWRNPCLNDTYEPGSTFKIITMSAGLEEGVVHMEDTFYCPGYKIVEDRTIHCSNRNGHGAQTFLQAVENSCNPAFMEIGLRLGVSGFYQYFRQFGLLKKTGVDFPGEASTIMHQEENMGEVELATTAFGQSFQVTPIALATAVCALINGGRRVTPHFGVAVESADGARVTELEYPVEDGIVSGETSRTVCSVLEKVVSEGTGKNAAIEGYSIGGKTATSQTLPRSANVYISSFLGFAPANEPQILCLCVIYDPQGTYYGGTVAAPVVRDIFENVLPYLGIEKETQEENGSSASAKG